MRAVVASEPTMTRWSFGGRREYTVRVDEAPVGHVRRLQSRWEAVSIPALFATRREAAQALVRQHQAMKEHEPDGR